MFVFGAFIKMIWSEMYCGLNLVGKIVLFPLFVVFTATLAVMGLVELFLIDSFVVLLTLFSKDMTVRDLFEFYS